jgi:hypothetical protein
MRDSAGAYDLEPPWVNGAPLRVMRSADAVLSWRVQMVVYVIVTLHKPWRPRLKSQFDTYRINLEFTFGGGLLLFLLALCRPGRQQIATNRGSAPNAEGDSHRQYELFLCVCHRYLSASGALLSCSTPYHRKKQRGPDWRGLFISGRPTAEAARLSVGKLLSIGQSRRSHGRWRGKRHVSIFLGNNSLGVP